MFPCTSYDQARTLFIDDPGDGEPEFTRHANTKEYSVGNDIMEGWYAGGGTKFALNNKVAIGIQYRHSDFGDEVFRFKPTFPIMPGATRVDLTSDQVEFTVDIMLGHLGN